MRREEVMKLYAQDVETDPQTGKEKPVLRYIGPYYRLEPHVRQTCLRMAWLCWGVAFTAMAVAGMIPTRAGGSAWVQVWYLLCVLPFFYLLLGALRMRKMGEKITEVDKGEGIAYVHGGAWGLAILGGLWAAADVIYLVMNGLPDIWGYDVLFLACGAVTAVMGLALARGMGLMKLEKMEQA